MPQPNAATAAGDNAQPKNPATPQDAKGAKPKPVAKEEKDGSRKGRILSFLKVPDEVAQDVLSGDEGEPDPKPKGQKPGDGEEPPAGEETPQGEETPAGEETPTGEEPPAGEETPQGEETPAGEESHKPNKKWPAEVQAEFQSRIGKEARKTRLAVEAREKAEQIAEELQGRLESSQPVVLPPSDDDPLAGVQDATALAQARHEAQLLKNWCRKYRNGFGEEGAEGAMSAVEVQGLLDQAEDLLSTHAPAKEKQLQKQAGFDTMAKGYYPWIFQKGSVGYQMSQAIMADVPGLARHPARNLMIGDYLSGLNARLAAAAKNGKGKKEGHPDLPDALAQERPPIAPSTPKPPSRQGERPSSNKKVEDAKNRIVETGGSKESIVAAVREIHSRDKQAPTGREPVQV